MSKIKAITEEYASHFEQNVQYYLDRGYKILNAYCGVINYTDGSTDSTYKAILLKEDKWWTDLYGSILNY